MTIIEILKKAEYFNDRDITDTFEMAPPSLGQPKKEGEVPKYRDNVEWIPVPLEKTAIRAQIHSLLRDNVLVAT